MLQLGMVGRDTWMDVLDQLTGQAGTLLPPTLSLIRAIQARLGQFEASLQAASLN